MPSEQDFETLFQTVGRGDMEKARQELIKGGSSGFNALPSGMLVEFYNGNLNHCMYGGIGKSTRFWIYSEKRGYYKPKTLYIDNTSMNVDDDMSYACPIRCIKD